MWLVVSQVTDWSTCGLDTTIANKMSEHVQSEVSESMAGLA